MRTSIAPALTTGFRLCPPPPRQSSMAHVRHAGCNATAYDVDGDGDFDLVIGDAAGRISYYENTGTAKHRNSNL